MARKPTPTLTEAELKVMEVVWDLGAASVNDVLDWYSDDIKPAYNTVLTIMRILEDKGYLEHRKNGRAFIYRPLVDRNHARRKAVRHLVRSFFDDSPELLMLNLINDEKLSRDELRRLKKMIAENEGGM
jgi:predicted transcriptional regulator